MTKNKIAQLALVFAGLGMFGAQPAIADPLSLTSGDKITLGYGGGANGDAWGGGPFLATGVSGSVLDGSSGSFITFCLEYNEHFSPGSQYFVKINTGAVNGGISSAGTYGGDVSGTSVFDPVSNATAWLYSEYRAGSLSGYNYSTNAQGASLQLAIWQLEGELSSTLSTNAFNAYGSDSVAQNWVTAAITQAGGGYTNSNVKVMNLYTSYSSGVFGGQSQDQLYISPVPEPESYAMLLAGLGLMGFVVRRRKSNAMRG